MSPENKPSTALITGATGFVGYSLARRLVADGWHVHAIIRPSSDRRSLAELQRTATLHAHDGGTEHMAGIVQNVQPTVVFHLASLFLAQHTPADVTPLIRSNVEFGAQLLEAMAAHNIPWLLNTGTSWQHFENKPNSPVCLYAATKQAFEAILQYYIETTPLKAITLKLFDTYGPGDRRRKLMALLEKTAKEGKPLAMSPGQQLIDMVYIDDVVDAFVMAANRLTSGSVADHETYSVSSASPLILKELVRTYAEVTGQPLDIRWGGRPYRPREVMVPWTQGQPLPGWRPRVSLAEGIRRLHESRLSEAR